MPKRLTYAEVKEYVESEGEILLSTSYINNRTKLKFRCNKNHDYEMTFSDFKSGYRCRYCIQVENTYKELGDCYEVIVSNTKYPCSFYISKESVDLVKQYKWHNVRGYIATSYQIDTCRFTTLSIHQLLMPNSPQGMTIDHKDRNRMNNRINNLRYATPTEQVLNRNKQKSNKTGRVGVCCVLQKYGDKFIATASINKKQYTKSFAINKYGKELAFEMACEQREKWEKEFNILSEKGRVLNGE